MKSNFIYSKLIPIPILSSIIEHCCLTSQKIYISIKNNHLKSTYALTMVYLTKITVPTLRTENILRCYLAPEDTLNSFSG